MKKLLILALLSFTANAEVWVKQIEAADGKGYAFALPRNGALNCWVMPEWVQISYFDLAWMTVPDTAINHLWPTGTTETAAICANGPQVPRTWGGPFMTFDDGMNYRWVKGGIPAGIPCGDRLNGRHIYAVTYNGIEGFAECL